MYNGWPTVDTASNVCRILGGFGEDASGVNRVKVCQAGGLPTLAHLYQNSLVDRCVHMAGAQARTTDQICTPPP